jgi:hypothetical protein
MAGTMPSHAQKLRNRGQILNTGTFAVRDSVIGLPATMGGTFVLNGLDQLVPARSYRNLSLVSPAVTTKQAAGNLFISDTLHIGANVTLAVPADSVVTLGIPTGRLTENGYISGRITKSVDLSGPTTTSDFGGIGLSLSWSSTAPGMTSVIRTSGMAISANGRTSIRRYYDVTTSQVAPADLQFSYVADEATGHDPGSLDIWRLPPGETRWRRQKVDRLGNTLIRNGGQAGGRYTAADAANPLDPIIKFEWEADTLRLAGVDSLRGRRSEYLDSLFVVRVTDAFDQPLANVLVNFTVTERPAGAVNDSLTNVSVMTDAGGRASTRLRLGDRSGRYEVTAEIPAAASVRPRKFIGYASSATIATVAKVTGDAQVDSIKTTLQVPFTVRVLDGDSLSVPMTSVRFVVASTPVGGESARLSDTLTTTDANGLASSVMTLGRRIGRYSVEARSVEVDSVLAMFNVEATHGIPTVLDTLSSMRQDTVAKQLAPFVVTIADGEGNPVRSAPVQFAITSTPAGASGQSVDAVGAVTDSLGRAFVRLTLGDRVGPYDLTASSPVIPGVVRTFRATAVAAAAAVLAEDLGDAQVRPILTVLDTAFVARVADRFGNPVAGVPVTFSVVDTPGAAVGQFLNRLVDTTDALGRASTTLRLGLKVGAYTVEADAPGLPPVRFTAFATPGTPKTLTALPIDTLVFIESATSPFIVAVSDTGDNLVPNVLVAFAVTQAPTGSVGVGVTASASATDSLGRASTRLLVGDRPGRYVVTATVSGVPAAFFTVDARALVGNPNLDLRIDIGDLTAIIDHILGRSILTGPQFRAADVDSNNVVDVRDALIARNYLLSNGRWNVADTVLNPVEFTAVREDRATGLSEGPSGAVDDVVGARSTGDPANTVAVLEHTTVGVRVNLTNDVPVKGVQVYLRLKQPVESLEKDVRFMRARNMDIYLTGDDREVRAVVYNFQNLPIDSGFGPVFRIPLPGLDTTQVDSVAVIISTGSGNVSTLLDQQLVTKTIGHYPTTFALYQNYPNPFNNETTIEYEVPEIAGRIPRVAIQIFNVIGEKVRTIDRQDRDAGRYVIRWNGRDDNGATVATGVYFYRLLSVDPVEGKHFATTKKMIMVK